MNNKTNKKAPASNVAARGRAAARKNTAIKPRGKNTARPTRGVAKKPLRVIPLGGLQEIGKNMCAIEYDDQILVVDSGLTFPGDDMPGVDVVIPDISYLEKNRDRVKAILLTHGHEDHIGAIPYVLQKVHTRIYCTRLTGGLLENKLKEFGIPADCIRYVQVKEPITLGPFKVEFIRVAHSIPDACAIAIFNPVGTLLFTGDFKMDFTPIDQEPTDLHRLAELGEEGVLALYSDSTNVEHGGYAISERVVGETFRQVFAETRGRIIVATFASNLHRVQQIIWAAEENKRKICLSGRSMLKNVQVASELGYLHVKSKTIIEINDLKNYKPSEVVLLITGTQGEPMSALSRMANDEHRKIALTADDTVILSASMIPGNEKSIGDMMNKLVAHGCRLIYSSLAEVHASGHACQEELKLMHSLVKPQFFIPAHGEMRMLIAHKNLAMAMGMKEDKIILADNGTVIQFEKKGRHHEVDVSNRVPAGQVLVDGLGIGDVGNVVLNDRKHLAEDGMIAVVLSFDPRTQQIQSGPEIVSRGFVYMKDNIDLIDEIKRVVLRIFDEAKQRHITDWNYLKMRIREDVKSFVFTEIQRNPMILSILLEAGNGAAENAPMEETMPKSRKRQGRRKNTAE